MSLRIEFEQFLAVVKQASADGRWTLDEVLLAARELADCAAPIIDALDPDDLDAIESLEQDLIDVARKAVETLPGGRLLKKPAVMAGINLGMPYLVRGAVAAGVPFRTWIEEHVLPSSMGLEQLLHRFNASFS